MPKRKFLSASPNPAPGGDPVARASSRETASYIRDMAGSLGQMAEANGLGPLMRLLAFVEHEADLIVRGEGPAH